MLENVRKRLRDLVRSSTSNSVRGFDSDFEDQIKDEVEIDLGLAQRETFEQFRAKARAFLQAHEDHAAINLLRTNKPLTASDLDEPELMLAESGVGASGTLEHAKTENEGLGLFVRSLVGLDREA